MNLQTISLGTIPDAILQQIKQLIREGQLKPGDRLPNERELGEKFGVGRSSVREAMKALVALGLVVRTREGTFVNPDPTKLVWNSLDHHHGITRSSIREVFEARRLFELGMAAMAAERATPEDIEEIWNWAPESVDSLDAFKLTDIRFHSAIAKATGNTFLAELYTHMQEVLFRTHQWFHALELLDKASLFKQLSVNLQQHRVIAQAISDRQPEAAQQAIAEHFASLEVSMLPDAPATDETEEEEDENRK
ncbi:MAG: FadR family transcriptional regulator [Alicyclobacillus sp.]|nr:FadR family transcriptional regulator [Alicyclobacillus sp.]